VDNSGITALLMAVTGLITLLLTKGPDAWALITKTKAERDKGIQDRDKAQRDYVLDQHQRVIAMMETRIAQSNAESDRLREIIAKLTVELERMLVPPVSTAHYQQDIEKVNKKMMDIIQNPPEPPRQEL
jgi:hypothetical protein